nr:ABC transporter substrate-binding protein [Pseudohalocynthiibacter aestuariivivens]
MTFCNNGSNSKRGMLAGLALSFLGATGAQAAEEVRISGLTWPGYGFWYIAMEKDLAPDLDLSYQRIEDPFESFNLVTAGQMDVVSNTAEFTPVGVARGMPIRLVALANLSNGADKIVLSPGYETAEDLKGAEVAVLEGGLAQIFVAMWLEQQGVAYDAVTYKNIIADDAFAAQVGGSVAASEYWEPYGSNVLKTVPGSSMAADSADPYWLKQAVVADGLYFGAEFIAERPDTARKTLKAMYDAISWWKNNPAEGNQIIADRMKMSLEDVEMVLGTEGTFLDGGLYVYDFMEAARFCGSAPGEAPFGQSNGQIADHWQLVSEWWVKFGLIERTSPASTGVECKLHADLYADGYRG